MAEFRKTRCRRGGELAAIASHNTHLLVFPVREAPMLKAAGKVILCVDHTKFGRKSVAQLCGLEAIDTIVTDEAAPADLIEALRSRGLDIVIAGAEVRHLAGEPQPAPPETATTTETARQLPLKAARPTASAPESTAFGNSAGSEMVGWD